MYMILYWVTDDYVTAIHNGNGSIKLFDTIKEADDYADNHHNKDDLRVITIDGA